MRLHPSLPVTALAVTIAAGAALAACFGGSTQSRRYFAVEYPRGEAVQRYQEPRYPFTLRVRRLESVVASDRQELVYRQTPYEISYDWYRLWAAKPRAMLGAIVRGHLRDANLFREVIERLTTTMPRYELGCEVLALEELEGEAMRFARVALRCVLVDFETGAQVFSHAFDAKQAVQQREAHFIVRALSTLLEREIDGLIDALDAYLAEATGLPKPSRKARPGPVESPGAAPPDPGLSPDEPGARLKPKP